MITPGKLMYLGYHGNTTGNGSTGKDSSDSKASSHHSSSSLIIIVLQGRRLILLNRIAIIVAASRPQNHIRIMTAMEVTKERKRAVRKGIAAVETASLEATPFFDF